MIWDNPRLDRLADAIREVASDDDLLNIVSCLGEDVLMEYLVDIGISVELTLDVDRVMISYPGNDEEWALKKVQLLIPHLRNLAENGKENGYYRT